MNDNLGAAVTTPLSHGEGQGGEAVFVYCEIEGTQVQEVSQELLTKGRKLANELGADLNAVVAGTGIKGKVDLNTYNGTYYSLKRMCIGN